MQMRSCAVFGIQKKGVEEPNPQCPLYLVRVVGVEPTRLSAQEPKSCTSANSAIPAYMSGMKACRYFVSLPCFYTERNRGGASLTRADKSGLLLSKKERQGQTLPLCLKILHGEITEAEHIA